MTAGVALDGRPDGWLDALAQRAQDAGDDVSAGIELAVDLGPEVPVPSGGETAKRWNVLASAAAGDVTAARVIEPHLDALAILAEAADDEVSPDLASVGADADSSWGVFAAEAPGVRLSATEDADGWRLDGVKPWCSLAGVLSHGLVTAHTDAGRRLFAVGLREPGVGVQDGGWHARGLSTVVSGPVEFAAVRAVPVGSSGLVPVQTGFLVGRHRGRRRLVGRRDRGSPAVVRESSEDPRSAAADPRPRPRRHRTVGGRRIAGCGGRRRSTTAPPTAWSWPAGSATRCTTRPS